MGQFIAEDRLMLVPTSDPSWLLVEGGVDLAREQPSRASRGEPSG